MSNIEVTQLLAVREAQLRLQFRTREGLEAHQRQQMLRLVGQVLPKSPYYKLLLSKPFEEWPAMNARLLGEYFDIINTCGLRKADLLARMDEGDAAASDGGQRALLSRGGGNLLLMGDEERLLRLGTLLAMLGELPQNIAYFFHSNYLLAGDIRDERLRIEGYDLAHSYAELCEQLLRQRPDVIIAPCTVLLRLYEDIHAGNLALALPRVYNTGEVLTRRDRLKLQTLFPYVGNIYLTAEALVAMTCAHGRLHLNEKNLLIQFEHLEGNRYLPLITDLHGSSVPLVQYRLNDIVVLDQQPCPCGCVQQVARHVEGSLEDILLLPGSERQRVRIYPNMCHDVLMRHLPKNSDYQLLQLGPCRLELCAAAEEEALENARYALQRAWRDLGVNVAKLAWHCRQTWGEHDLGRKRRQIMRASAQGN